MTSLRVLIVEDSEDDALLLTDHLCRGGFDPESRVVDDLSDMESALDEEWDVIISDYVLPDFSGMEALRLAREKRPDTPFMMVSGKVGEDVAVETMKAGANDYILKNNLARLVPAVERELREAEVRRERRQSQKELDKARELAEYAAKLEADTRATLEALLAATPVGIVTLDAATRKITYFNAAAAGIFGGPVAGLGGLPQPDAYQMLRLDGTPYGPDETPLYRALVNGGNRLNEQMLIRRRDGSTVSVHVTCAPVLDVDRRVTGVILTLDDVTEMLELRREIEESLERERYFSLLLQRALLPEVPAIGEGYSIAVEYVPLFASREIGGDFYDVYNVADCRAGVLIGDVSGKGLEAAAMAATTRSTVHAFIHESPSSGDALTRANAVMGSSQIVFESFATTFLIVLDICSGDFTYSNAGHPPAMLCKANTEVEILELGGLPLGLGAEQRYEEHLGHLGEGDKLILYTDGISEARNGSGLFDLEGLQRILGENSHMSAAELAKAVIKGATDWAGGKLADDAAVVVIERLSSLC